MIEESYKTYKPEIIRIRLSTPFITRTRCKFCQGPPTIYYYVRNATLWFNPRKITEEFEWVKKHFQRLGLDYFMSADPKDYHGTSPYRHSPIYKGYRPKLHRTRGALPTFDIVEFVTCDCQQSTWAYSEKAVEKRPEIMQRKARFRFPNKFEY